MGAPAGGGVGQGSGGRFLDATSCGGSTHATASPHRARKPCHPERSEGPAPPVSNSGEAGPLSLSLLGMATPRRPPPAHRRGPRWPPAGKNRQRGGNRAARGRSRIGDRTGGGRASGALQCPPSCPSLTTTSGVVWRALTRPCGSPTPRALAGPGGCARAVMLGGQAPGAVHPASAGTHLRGDSVLAT